MGNDDPLQGAGRPWIGKFSCAGYGIENENWSLAVVSTLRSDQVPEALGLLAMISLYRGELHKVSGVPRQWTVPKSTIPVSVFVKALRKRNAALLRELQSSSSPEKILLPSSLTPVRSNESVKLTPSHISRELVPPDIIASGWGCGLVGCIVEESKNITLAGKRAESSEMIEAESSERIEEESEVLQERKRKKQQDTRGEIVRQNPKYDGEQRDVENQEKLSTVQAEDSFRGFESMALDVIEKFEEMDCDILGVEKTGSDYAEVIRCPEDLRKDSHFGDVVGEKVSDKSARKRKREELQAKLEKLTADKHHLVLMLKQVLNEEESKKRVSSTNPPQHAGAGVSSAIDTQLVASHGEKLGALQPSGDLEEGELEYARTPSPPPRPVHNSHSNLNSHNLLGPPPPMVPILGRQNTLTQHISQGSSGRGGYYVPGTGIQPSPVGPGIGGGGALSPGAVYIGNLPSPLGPHNYSHNLALQHAAAIHAQKIVPVPPVHGQFNPNPPNGAPLAPGLGVAGGPPGFGGYVVPPPLHPHHPHLSQTAASSTSHIPVQQGVVSPSLLTTPRAPVAYHDMRLGGSTWIPR